MKKIKRIIKIPEHILSFMEWYFGLSFRKIHFYESDTIGTHHAYAYAKGDEVHIGIKNFKPNTLMGVAIIGHELTHIIQQSKLTGLHNLLYEEKSLEKALEEEAYYHAFHIAKLYSILLQSKKKIGMRKFFRIQSSKELDFIPSKVAPVQLWQVGGYDAALFQNVKFHEKLEGITFDKSKQWTIKYGADIVITSKGVHETFTRFGYREVKDVINRVNDFRLNRTRNQRTVNEEQDNIEENLVFGSRFNDVGIYDNINFAMVYSVAFGKYNATDIENEELPERLSELKKKVGNAYVWTTRTGGTMYADEYILETHDGCLQFLHSMDTSKGKLLRNIDKMCRWAKFCIEVYQNHEVTITEKYVKALQEPCNEKVDQKVKFQDLNLLRYVLSLDENEDILACMLSPLVLRIDRNADYEDEKTEEKAESKSISKEKLMEKIEDSDFLHQYLRYLEENDENCADIETVEAMELEKVRYIKRLFRTEKDALEEYASTYGTEKVTIGTFFGRILYGSSDKVLEKIHKLEPGLVAIGTVCHMIQDSFAGSHVRRGYTEKEQELYKEEIKNEIRDCNANDIKKKMKQLRQELLQNIPPVILCADYKMQSSAKHQYADNLLRNFDIDDKELEKKKSEGEQAEIEFLLAEHMKTTAGAVFAKECTAHILYMVLTGEEVNEIVGFIRQIYKLPIVEWQESSKWIPSGKTYALDSQMRSAGGYPYEYIGKYKEPPKPGAKVESNGENYEGLYNRYQNNVFQNGARNKRAVNCYFQLAIIENQLSQLKTLLVTLSNEFETNRKKYINTRWKFFSESISIMEVRGKAIYHLKKHVYEMMLEIMLITNILFSKNQYIEQKNIRMFNLCAQHIGAIFLNFSWQNDEVLKIFNEIKRKLNE